MFNTPTANHDERDFKSLISQFDTAVFLIGVGLRDKDSLYDNNPEKYPYSSNFRHGLNMFSALCAQYAGPNAAKVLSELNESRFIREYCSKSVCDWISDWDEEPQQALSKAECFKYGALAQVDDGFFAPTDECYDLIAHAEPDTVGAYQERKVYDFLRAGTQEQYAFGRLFLTRHPLLTWDECTSVRTGRYDFSSEALMSAESVPDDLNWLSELLDLAYEQAPDNLKICPNCGWTMGKRGRQAYCSSSACKNGLPADLNSLQDVPSGAYRLKRGVMHYIASPGKLELALAERALSLGLPFEMWPLKDTCDVLVSLPSGKTLALDAKTYCNPKRLAREIVEDDAIERVGASENVYVVPDDVEKEQPGYCRLCNQLVGRGESYPCVAFSKLVKRLTADAKGAR